jgi:hypothetical protein
MPYLVEIANRAIYILIQSPIRSFGQIVRFNRSSIRSIQMNRKHHTIGRLLCIIYSHIKAHHGGIIAICKYSRFAWVVAMRGSILRKHKAQAYANAQRSAGKERLRQRINDIAIRSTKILKSIDMSGLKVVDITHLISQLYGSPT